MPEGILLDNDVILKACAYRCHGEVVAATTLQDKPPAILGIARFTLRTRLSRPSALSDPQGAADVLEQLLAQVRLLHPTEDEIELAAELEERATAHTFQFDTGESQLVAILMSRDATLLVTGDKRAITALASIGLTEVEGRIGCLEQLVARLLKKHPQEVVRQRVCAEPVADRAVTNCFACSAASVSVDDILAGLASYTDHLRNVTGGMLISDADLVTVIP